MRLPRNPELRALVLELRRFAVQRDWNQFHSPKNLVMALSVEVSEIMEHLQWLTEEQSRQINRRKLSEVAEEIGDVLIYLLRLADQLGIDPLAAARNKLRRNAVKYPVAKARGNARKYTEL